MATVDTWTVGCPATTTGNQISISNIGLLSSEAYVEVVSQYSVTSEVTVLVSVYDDCSTNTAYVYVVLSVGSSYGFASSSGFGACGYLSGSILSLSPEVDGTYDYYF